jgi:hypothetical protein
MVKLAHGGMVTTAKTAESIAAAILRGHHGDKEFAIQQPLVVSDKGECWRVEGSHEEPGWGPRGRAWYIEIMKDDGRVVKVAHRMPPVDPPDEVKALIEEERKRRSLDRG